MEVGKYYVISMGNNLDESMTKEQIIAAIAEATGETPTSVDDAFITKLKEQNKNKALKLWVGTQAEYNRIQSPATDTLYIITDVDEYEERFVTIENDLAALENYSTEETVVGTWIDGKTLYRKTINIGALPNAAESDIDHNIENIYQIVKIGGFAKSGNTYIPLPFAPVTNLNTSIALMATTTQIKVITEMNRSNFTGVVTLEYTKV